MKIFNHGDGAMPKRAVEYDIPIAAMYENLALRGLSLKANGMYIAAVMLMLAINKPLPSNTKAASKMVRSTSRRVYERCLAELIDDGCLIRLPSGEIWAPIIAGVRPSRGARQDRPIRFAIPRSDRDAVLAKTAGQCAYCTVVLTLDAGSPTSFEVDHVLAVVRGGSDDIANLIPSCRACNAAKKDKTALQFLSNAKGTPHA